MPTEIVTSEITSLGVFIQNLLLAGVLAFILRQVYIKFGRSLSNRNTFSQNFISLTMTTMLIITVVKSSLALSLGLVGALSIVRFRTAIKEPEEITFLFICISVGLGLGADQRWLTLAGFAIIMVALTLVSFKKSQSQDFNMTLSVKDSSGVDNVDKIVLLLKENTTAVQLRRLDDQQNLRHLIFDVEMSSFEELNECRTKLMALAPEIQVSYLHDNGIV